MSQENDQAATLAGQPIGGVDRSTNPATFHVLNTDASGNLKLSATVTGGNAAAGLTGAAVPVDADYIGFNVSGNLVGVSALAPLPVAPIGKRSNQVLTVIPLAANAVFTSAWQDTVLDGSVFLQLTSYSDQGSAGIAFDFSNDITNANLTQTSALFNASAAKLFSVQFAIPARYWRVRYTNGTVSQTSFEIAVTASSTEPLSVDVISGPTSGTGLTVTANPLVAGTATIGKIDILGNNGGIIDAPIGASVAPTNGIATLGVYSSTSPALTTGKSAAIQTDANASAFVVPYRRSQLVPQATTVTGTTATTIMAAQAGVFTDISFLVVTVAPGQSDIAFTITLSDGVQNYLFDLDTGSTSTLVPADRLRMAFSPPLPASSVGTAWTLTSSVNLTLHVTAIGIKQQAS